jgi:hypothetical protein
MAGKYCPKCNKRMKKALMVTEMIAKWSDEGFYLPDDSNTDAMKTYEKCLACGTVLLGGPVNSREVTAKKKKIIILALCGEASGYMDDGNGEYKGFAVNQENRVFIEGVYPRKTHWGRVKLADIMGKFDPDTLFLLEPIEVDKLDYNELKELYWKCYKLPYHGGFKIIRKNGQKVEIVWDGSERREILSQEDCKDLKLGFQKVSKNHHTK